MGAVDEDLIDLALPRQLAQLFQSPENRQAIETVRCPVVDDADKANMVEFQRANQPFGQGNRLRIRAVERDALLDVSSAGKGSDDPTEKRARRSQASNQ